MKFTTLAVAALLGTVTFVSEGTQAIKVGEEMNNVQKSKGGKKNMISVGLTKTRYENNRYQEYVKPISKESRLSLAQALNLPLVKGKDGQLMLAEDKKDKNHHVVDVSMVNLENMGYEGSFQFGNPSQELQVIFDTGSAWAWVFSETCGTNQKLCPARAVKFLESKSKGFKMNKKGG